MILGLFSVQVKMSWTEENKETNSTVRNVILFGLIILLSFGAILGACLIFSTMKKDSEVEQIQTKGLMKINMKTSTSSTTITTTTTTTSTTTLDLSMCLIDKLNDGNCDPENLKGICYHDNFDCCDGNQTLIGNEKCDLDLDVLECNFDGGDCREDNRIKAKYSGYVATSSSIYAMDLCFGSVPKLIFQAVKSLSFSEVSQ